MEDFIDSEIDSELDILAGFGEDEKRNNEDDVDAVAYDRYDDEDTF